MPRRVLVQKDGEAFDLIEAPAPNEHHLQEVMKSRPQLIPSDDLGLDGDLLVVGRETSLASGYIDLLCLAQSGDLVLVEFKTGPQNPDFRHALAQLIDYGSDLWKLTVEDFDRGVVQRYLRSDRSAPAFASASNLDEAIAHSGWALDEDDRAALDSRLAEVLADGDFHYVVAAQRFTSAMQTSLEYMNATMRFGRFYLVEIVQLEGEDFTAHAAQVVAAPPRKTGGTFSTISEKANEVDYLAQISDEDYREAMQDLFSACSTLGLEVVWRSKGLSIRLQTPDRKRPLSVGWALPPGSHWQGVRHLGFGIDPRQLEQTPSVAGAMKEFVAQLKSIPGAKTVTSSLDAYSFEPDAVAAAMKLIIASLDQLVADVQIVQ